MQAYEGAPQLQRSGSHSLAAGYPARAGLRSAVSQLALAAAVSVAVARAACAELLAKVQAGDADAVRCAGVAWPFLCALRRVPLAALTRLHPLA